jgi:hypothetical protein
MAASLGFSLHHNWALTIAFTAFRTICLNPAISMFLKHPHQYLLCYDLWSLLACLIKNYFTARETLRSKKIHIASEDTDGKLGRKVVFDSSSSEIAILKTGKLRKSDWHPYVDVR